MSSTTLDLPGVYLQPRPRINEAPRVRTDVAGFIGFEARIRPAIAHLDSAPDLHVVSVAVERFHVRIDGRTTLVDVGPSLVLSEGPGHSLADGESMSYSIVAGVAQDPLFFPEDHEPQRAELFVVPGEPSPVAPIDASDAKVAVFIAAQQVIDPGWRLRPGWSRLADAHLRRVGEALWLTIVPRFEPTLCDDWNDYRLRFGVPSDGMRLTETVRAFFANGGARCVITTVRRPFDTDAVELAIARREMIGQRDSSWTSATGLAKLKLVDAVALVACPDLHARRSEQTDEQIKIPPDLTDAAFVPCGPDATPEPPVTGTTILDVPIYPALDDVFDTQRSLLFGAREGANPVHVFLTPPLHLDAASGRFRPPDGNETDAWRRRFATDPTLSGDDDRSTSALAFGACYWPWLRRQDATDQPPYDSPPLGVVVGIVAAQDLERGPFVAPANRSANGVVGLSTPVQVDMQRMLYEPAIGNVPGRRGAVNAFRPTRTRGMELWGSRTLSGDTWFRHLSIRRGLSAIERRARAALAEIVFEPNSPMLQLQVTQLLLGILLDASESGALRGSRPEESFVIRCDESLNSVDDVQNGRLICEVGVALAAPSEFIFFRLGRVGGAIEVIEP